MIFCYTGLGTGHSSFFWVEDSTLSTDLSFRKASRQSSYHHGTHLAKSSPLNTRSLAVQSEVYAGVDEAAVPSPFMEDKIQLKRSVTRFFFLMKQHIKQQNSSWEIQRHLGVCVSAYTCKVNKKFTLYSASPPKMSESHYFIGLFLLICFEFYWLFFCSKMLLKPYSEFYFR